MRVCDRCHVANCDGQPIFRARDGLEGMSASGPLEIGANEWLVRYDWNINDEGFAYYRVVEATGDEVLLRLSTPLFRAPISAAVYMCCLPVTVMR